MIKLYLNNLWMALFREDGLAWDWAVWRFGRFLCLVFICLDRNEPDGVDSHVGADDRGDVAYQRWMAHQWRKLFRQCGCLLVGIGVDDRQLFVGGG